MGVKFGTEEGTFGLLLRTKFHPHRCNVSPLRGEKPQNRLLSKLNTGRFALRAMLPVKRVAADRDQLELLQISNLSVISYAVVRRILKNLTLDIILYQIKTS